MIKCSRGVAVTVLLLFQFGLAVSQEKYEGMEQHCLLERLSEQTSGCLARQTPEPVIRYLVTGAAGFIGFHISRRLLEEGHVVYGYDNLNDNYDGNLKEARLEQLQGYCDFKFIKGDITDYRLLGEVFSQGAIRRVIHMAALAGVRYSSEKPISYFSDNLMGKGVILELCRSHGVEHLVYASSSSVYGLNTKQPFSESDHTDHPTSIYAATKKSNELMAHAYSESFKLPTTGLRFFTVYGPWGRPDMAPYLFTKAILSNEPIRLYNFGQMSRDFTYIEDIVDGVLKAASNIPQADNDWDGSAGRSSAPYRVYNLGSGVAVPLMTLVAEIEKATGKNATLNLEAMQTGDVTSTLADITEARRHLDFHPETDIQTGIAEMVAWYLDYYKIN